MISNTIFNFKNWSTLYAAKTNLQNNALQYFYHPNKKIAEQLKISEMQLISTTVITRDCEQSGKFMLQPYQFFEF